LAVAEKKVRYRIASYEKNECCDSGAKEVQQPCIRTDLP
jgi:hypothetical protein